MRIQVNHKSVSSDAFKGKPRKYVEEALANFFSRPFILMGRVYRAYFAKDHTVLLVLTNERVRLTEQVYEVYPPAGGCPDNGLSIDGLYNWYNPLVLNTAQVSIIVPISNYHL